MKVSLIDYTGNGHYDPDHAMNILLFTKNTRLTMSPGLLDEIAEWPRDKKLKELEYMANTIPSSWEFVDYTFLIEGVTRAFTHQLVRTRTASFAQQTMRVLDVSEGTGWDYLTGPSITPDKQLTYGEGENITAEDIYHSAMDTVDLAYKDLIKAGVKIEDARGVLPTNILTNIVVKMNMRTMVDTIRKRRSPRTQGEYRDVILAMEEQVLALHPWVALFLQRGEDFAMKALDTAIQKFVPAEEQANMHKLVDMIRRG